MSGLNQAAIDAAEAELRRLAKRRDPSWTGNCYGDAIAVLATARPHIEADLIARLISDRAVEAAAFALNAHWGEAAISGPESETYTDAEVAVAAAVRAVQGEA